MLADFVNVKGFAEALMFFKPKDMHGLGVIGETGVNDEEFVDWEAKLWNSGCIVKCACCENDGDIS